MATNPFGGDCLPTRIPLFGQPGRPTLPFPHPWNFDRPIDILATFFWRAEEESGPGRHNRFLSVPGFSPVLVTRDPGVIRAILTATGDREGQFDRDTLPSTGIARATGEDTLLFGNGPMWRRQRKASAAPFGKTALFADDVFRDFEDVFRGTVQQRLMVLRGHLLQTGSSRQQVAVEPEIKALMLEMLVRCFFGAQIAYDQLRNEYVPTLERVVDRIVRDTVLSRFGLPSAIAARLGGHYAAMRRDLRTFEELTDRVLAARGSGRGLWHKLRSEAPDEALRSNTRSSWRALWRRPLRTRRGHSRTSPAAKRGRRRSSERWRRWPTSLPNESRQPSTWPPSWRRRSA